MRTRRKRWKQANRPKIIIVRKIKVVCICKRGNCEGFCNGIGNVDIRKKTIAKSRKSCACKRR